MNTSNISTSNLVEIRESNDIYEHMEYRIEPEQHSIWWYFNPESRPCFTDDLLDDMGRAQQLLKRVCDPKITVESDCVHYIVLGSKTPGIFSLGGDLDMFADLIRKHDRDALYKYAVKSIDVMYQHAINYNLPVTTIGLLQGDAISACLETALSCDVIIAEKQVKMGFPEILFNRFPGMGACSMLAQRFNSTLAEKLILSGTIYSAEEMYEMGIVDILVDEGEGEDAVREYIRKKDRFRHARQAIYRVRNCVNSLSYDELIDIVGIWTDAAMQLSDKNLKVMQRLVRAQNRKTGSDRPAKPESIDSAVV